MGPRVPPAAQAPWAAPNSHRAWAACENTNKFGFKHAFFGLNLMLKGMEWQ